MNEYVILWKLRDDRKWVLNIVFFYLDFLESRFWVRGLRSSIILGRVILGSRRGRMDKRSEANKEGYVRWSCIIKLVLWWLINFLFYRIIYSFFILIFKLNILYFRIIYDGEKGSSNFVIYLGCIYVGIEWDLEVVLIGKFRVV